MDRLHEPLADEFGDGPPTAGTDVVAGRRVLTRRRMASGAAGLATAAVLVTGWYVVSPTSSTGSERLTGSPPATSSAPEGTAGASAEPAGEPWPRGELIRYVDGELETRPGLIVHERLRNPYDFAPPELSDALDVTWRGQRQWLTIEKRLKPRGISSSATAPSSCERRMRIRHLSTS